MPSYLSISVEQQHSLFRGVLVYFRLNAKMRHDYSAPNYFNDAAAINTTCKLTFTPIVTGTLSLLFFMLTLSVIQFSPQLLPDQLTPPLPLSGSL